jgi:electron transfer flavoprotein alpha subunit
VIFVLVEQGSELSLEALTVARTLGQPLEAVTFSRNTVSLGGVQRVIGVRDERLSAYAPEAWAESLAQLVRARSPEAVVAAASDRGSEVMAHLAAKLGVALAANCIAVKPGEPWTLTRQRWGGSLLEEATLSGEPKLVTVAPHVAAAEAVDGAAPAVEEFRPELDDSHFRVRVTRREEPEAGVIQLTDARVVVGGGRGVGSAEGFAVLEELASLLGGAVGGSRVVTNLGWRSHADQIGQTGARIAPELYIACGVSGAIQHMVGAKGAKRILAINKDKDAPIVQRAAYAVIGDLHEIVPAIVAELRKA